MSLGSGGRRKTLGVLRPLWLSEGEGGIGALIGAGWAVGYGLEPAAEQVRLRQPPKPQGY